MITNLNNNHLTLKNFLFGHIKLNYVKILMKIQLNRLIYECMF